MRPYFPLAALMLTLPAAVAQEKAADFGEGLKQLAALGLPEMKDAQWAKAGKGEDGRGLFDDYQFRELGLRLHGGRWKLAGEPARTIGFGTAETIGGEAEEAAAAVAENAKPNLLQKMLRNQAAKDPKPEEKAGPDLEADVKTLVETLAKDPARRELAQEMEYGRYNMPGRFLVFAAQLHAAGKTDAANRVAAALFAMAPDKTMLIDAAVSQFAEAEYQKATTAFFEKPDWAEYHKTLKALLAKYPRGWSSAGAVAMLMVPLEKRVAGAPSPVAAPPGIELKPEAVAALNELLEPLPAAGQSDEELAKANGVDLSDIPAQHRAQYLAMLRQGNFGGRSQQVWLLSKEGLDKNSKDPLTRLKAMGMDGLIALAAAATDGTLTPQSSQNERSYYSYSSYGSQRSPEDIAAETYRSMTRPSSRGELALRALAEVVPVADERSGGPNHEDLQAAAIEFWKENRAKSEVELATAYLTAGGSIQKYTAAVFLSGHADPAAHAAFEKAVLATEDAASFTQPVETYLDKRKGAGKAFFEAYAKMLREQYEGNDEALRRSSGGYQLREAGGVEKYIKKLSIKVGGTSLKEMLDEAMKAPLPAVNAEDKSEEEEEGDEPGSKATPFSNLSPALDQTPVPECMKVMGEAAAKANPQQFTSIMKALSATFYASSRRSQVPRGSLLPAVVIPAEVLAIWKPLLAKSDALPEDTKTSLKRYGCNTTGDLAALTVQFATFPGDNAALNDFMRVGTEAELGAFVRARAEALTDGKEAPAWPSAEAVKPERKAEISAKLGSLPAKEILTFAKELSREEKLLVVLLVSEYDEETPAPAGLFELKNTVVKLSHWSSAEPHDAALLGKLGIGEGWKVTPENLTALIDRLTTGAKEYSNTSISLYTTELGLGIGATAFKNPVDPAGKSGASSHHETIAHYFESQGNPEALAVIRIDDEMEFRALKGGKVVESVEEDDDTGEKESPGLAFEQLKEALAAKGMEMPYIELQVLTREDAEKLNKEE